MLCLCMYRSRIVTHLPENIMKDIKQIYKKELIELFIKDHLSISYS